MIANLLTIAGIDHVITLDLHVGVSGFVTIDSTSSQSGGPPVRKILTFGWIDRHRKCKAFSGNRWIICSLNP